MLTYFYENLGKIRRTAPVRSTQVDTIRDGGLTQSQMKITRVLRFLLPILFYTSAHAYVPPVGIPNPKDSFGSFDPIDTPKPDPRIYAPGWFAATPRANSKAAGDARDCYYVDNTKASATDSNNPYGNPTKPRLTVPTVTFAAGSYIEIHGDGGTGAHKYSTVFKPDGVGTDAAPIWFVGVNNPILSGLCDIGFSNRAKIAYLVFDGIHWKSGGKIAVRPRYDNNAFSNIVFRNCVLKGTGLAGQGGGIGIGTAISSMNASRTTKNIVIYKCEVSNYGNKSAPAEECGVYPSGYVTNLWFLEGSVHDVAEDGFGGSHGGQRTSTGYYIGRTRIYDNLTNGIDIKQMGKVVISECEIWGASASAPNATGAGEAIVLHYSGDSTPGLSETTWKNWPEDVSVLFSTIHDSDFGIVCSTIDRFRAVGNVFYNIKHSKSDWNGSSAYSAGTAIHMRGVRMSSSIVNNTIYDSDNGIQVPDTINAYNGGTKYWRGNQVSYSNRTYVCIQDNHPTGTTGIVPTNTAYWQEMKLQIRGNVISKRAEPAGRDIYFASSSWPSNTLDLDYNLTHSVNGEAYSFGSSTTRDLAWVKANTPHQKNGLASDPQFTDADDYIFTLKTASPAIALVAEGTRTLAYSDIESVAPAPVSVIQPLAAPANVRVVP